ncbi:hypothetical protein QBC33DRAFT_582425 [Phialemonium atrogriseum]|uniref:Uncharacterized protein n=1 Tax=Phialemonium atrogriseum TaxID=1093897 RepID=A0AAJ0CAX3_9PEZI|nr:uncharacterized protein QBC33DRAFT_582425 [Phialemonium atrogriseum]KAK1772143.1 hypothetical protein QBC33DRAFT_582425 [Phialemonium atrogriseum]
MVKPNDAIALVIALHVVILVIISYLLVRAMRTVGVVATVKFTSTSYSWISDDVPAPPHTPVRVNVPPPPPGPGPGRHANPGGRVNIDAGRGRAGGGGGGGGRVNIAPGSRSGNGGGRRTGSVVNVQPGPGGRVNIA